MSAVSVSFEAMSKDHVAFFAIDASGVVLASCLLEVENAKKAEKELKDAIWDAEKCWAPCPGRDLHCESFRGHDDHERDHHHKHEVTFKDEHGNDVCIKWDGEPKPRPCPETEP